jgi:hypothetical protein
LMLCHFHVSGNEMTLGWSDGLQALIKCIP